MPAVFVHGVPDTHHEWDGLFPLLSRTDVVAPDLPGFGCPVPDGFDCTKEAYAAWIERELEALGEPVDLVGHDWGSLLVQYVGSTRPDLVRTWCVADGPVDTEYVWHETAQLWQTPEVGEQVDRGDDGGRARRRHPRHRPSVGRTRPPPASTTRCATRILKLYRSAVDIGERSGSRRSSATSGRCS